MTDLLGIPEAMLVLSDNTTADASTSKHGLEPKSTAPAAGLLSVLGIANGETARTDKALFDATNPAAIGTASPGTSLSAARRDHVHAITAALPAVDGSALTGLGCVPGGRLTLESGMPVSTADQSAKGTLYYTPYVHDALWTYDSSLVTRHTFTEISLSLTVTSGKNYDVFVWNNGGTLTLELSAAWTTDTARADALAWQAGLGYVKSGTATRFWLGTIRASAANKVSDAAAQRFVSNTYNTEWRAISATNSTVSWTCSARSWRESNAGTGQTRIEYVGCMANTVSVFGLQQAAPGSGAAYRFGISADSYAGPYGFGSYWNQLMGIPMPANWYGLTGPGYHYLTTTEMADSGTVTVYGTPGGLTYGGLLKC